MLVTIINAKRRLIWTEDLVKRLDWIIFSGDKQAALADYFSIKCKYKLKAEKSASFHSNLLATKRGFLSPQSPVIPHHQQKNVSEN